MDRIKAVLNLLWIIWTRRDLIVNAFEYMPWLELKIKETVEMLADGNVTRGELQDALDTLRELPDVIEGVVALAEESGLLKYDR